MILARILAFGLVIFLGCGGVSQAQERPLCAPNLRTALGFLERQAGQFAIGSAINEHRHFTAFTVNRETGHWSMIVVMPNEEACIVHAGTEWQFTRFGEPT